MGGGRHVSEGHFRNKHSDGKVTQGKKAQEKWGDKEKPGGELGVILGCAGFLQVMEMKE